VPKVVVAKDGDTLCGIAIDNGFHDCRPVRDANPGAEFLSRPLRAGDPVTVPDIELHTETKSTSATHVFVKKNAPPVSICFVHGSPDRPYLDDDHLTFLLISKFQVDRGGPTGAAPFPDQFEFHAEADVDVAAFKVQVVDPAAGASVQVTLEALKPVYKPDGTIDHHELFTGAEYARRKLVVECAKVHSGVAYRSKYLRLVVDEADKDGTVGPVPPNTFPPGPGSPRPAQTLLVTDMVDQGEPDVEILDQKVRASYEIPRCPGSPKCAAVAELPIGNDRQRLRMFVHVMRRTPGGAPVVTVENARRRVLKWFRRVLAQSSIAPKLLGVEERDPVENMISISDPGSGPPTPGANAGGSSASGIDLLGNPSRLGFRLNSPGEPSVTVGPITPVDSSTGIGFTPLQTANALAAAVPPPFVAVAAGNPRRFNDTQGSADLVITRSDGKFVTIDQVVSTDTAQVIQAVSINPLPAPQQSWDGQNFLVGTAHQRIMCRNYDTGTDRVDVFVVDSTSDGNRGEAMMSGHAVNPDPTTHGADAVKFSIFCIQSTMDGTDADPLVLCHEIGHVAAEVGHALHVPTELMSAAVTGNHAVGASKRLTDRGVQYNITNGTFFINQRLRTEAGNAGILEPW
jgi:hypothetical protein